MSESPEGAGDRDLYVRRPGHPGRPGHPDAPPGRIEATDDALATRRSEQLAETGVTWNAADIRLDRIERTSVERARARFRASLPDLIWNTARFEGNAFTLPEVQTLLDGVSVGGRRLEDQEQILALSAAYSDLDELVGEGRFALTKAVSDELHLLVAHREAIESGHFRGEGLVTGGGNVRLANGGTTAGVPTGDRGRNLVERFDRTRAHVTRLDPREGALAYFAAATRSQFYFDGNKRTARLMMTGTLMAAGFEAVNIPYSRQYEFNRALDHLFETDEATPLLSFVADCAR
jgi:prophage maintenance system killer protein